MKLMCWETRKGDHPCPDWGTSLKSLDRDAFLYQMDKIIVPPYLDGKSQLEILKGCDNILMTINHIFENLMQTDHIWYPFP